MLEFTLAVSLVVLPLISGILEFAQLANTRQMLSIATSEAARAAAISDMDGRSAIVRLAIPELSVDASVRMSLARGLIPLLGASYAGSSVEDGANLLAEALLEAADPRRLRYTIDKSVVSSADIEVDRLQVTYCRELFFAPASFVMPALMKLWSEDLFELSCYDEDRIPITVYSPMSRSRFP